MEGVAFLSDFIMPDILVWFPFIKHWLLLFVFGLQQISVTSGV